MQVDYTLSPLPAAGPGTLSDVQLSRRLYPSQLQGHDVVRVVPTCCGADSDEHGQGGQDDVVMVTQLLPVE